MKKLTRKLIPAFAMLLISAVLMSTASFAWFSMNGAVTASGFKVTATAPAALWISEDGTANSYTSSFTFTGAGKTMDPVTNVGATNHNTDDPDGWTFNELNDYTKVNHLGQLVVNDAVVEDADLPDYLIDDGQNNVFMTEFYLLLEGNRESEATLEKKVVSSYITVSGTNTTDGVYKSIRVALVTSGGTAATLTKSSAGSCVMTPHTTLGQAGAAQEFTTVTAQDPIHVYVYIWFEGTDDACYNTNAQNLDEFSVSISFTAANP